MALLRTRGPRVRLMAALAMLLCMLLTAQAALMAIDLGTDTMKIAMVGKRDRKPGDSPIEIVLNEGGSRKTPTGVAFARGERVTGGNLATVRSKFPQDTYTRIMDMLGRQYDDEDLRAKMAATLRPFEIVASDNRGRAGVVSKEGPMTAEELLGHVLVYAKNLATDVNGGEPVNQVTLVVPPHFGHAARQAVLDAAELAGLKVLSIVNSHAAAALRYMVQGVYVPSTSKREAERVLFYDMGAGSTVVALVEYTTAAGGVGEAVVRDVAWDADLGGEALEMALVDDLARRFNADHVAELAGRDIRDDAKAMLRLQSACRRAKEVLSANTETVVYIDEFLGDTPLTYKLARADLEAAVAPLLARAQEPLAAIVARNALRAEQLANFELLGGGTRVPGVVTAISAALPGADVSRHLDSDEAVVWGGAMFAANSSSSFKMKRFLFTDGAPHAYDLVTWPAGQSSATHPVAGLMRDWEARAAAAGPEGEAPPPPVRRVLPRMFPTGRGRQVVLFDAADGMAIEVVASEEGNPQGRPRDLAKPVLGRWFLGGLAAAEAAHGADSIEKVTVTVRVDHGGMVRVTSPTAHVRTVHKVEKRVLVEEEGEGEGEGEEAATGAGAGAPGSSPGAEGEGQGAEGAEGASRPKRRVYKTVTVDEPAVERVALELTGGVLGGEMDRATWASVTARFGAIEEREAVKHRVLSLQHRLETDLFAWMDHVGGGDAHDYATAAERSAIQSFLADLEEWLYDEGMDETDPAVLQGRLDALHEAVRGPRTRMREAQERLFVVPEVLALADEVEAEVEGWEESRPWLGRDEREEVLEEARGLREWVQAVADAAKGQPRDADPAVTVAEMVGRGAALERHRDKLARRQKPREAPREEGPGEEGGAGDADGGAHEEL